jgi:ligand-binding sensor domain-containing protein
MFMAARYKLLFFIFICVVSFSKSYAVKFYSINSLHGISLREVNSVCSDNYGFIWASSKSGILRLTEDDYRIYELPYGNTNVLVVKLVYEYGRLVAYTNNGQIFLFNTTYDRFELVVDLSVVLDSKYLSVYGFLIDESGTYWIATTFGFYKYQNGQLTLFYQISSWNYSVAMIGKHHIALVENEGIWVLDMRTDKSKCVYNFPKEKPVQVSTLFFDAGTNKLWIGTLDNGLFIFNLNKNTLSPVLESTLPTQPILAIEKNSESTYMIGVDGQGIWEIDSEGRWVVNVFKDDIDDASALKGNGVYDLYCDANKRVWVCTFSGGLSFFDQATPMVTQVTHLANNRNSLINNDVNSVIEDREGKLWFATNNGVSCWDVRNNKWNHFLSTNQKQAKVFLTLCEDDKGRIWAGSYSSGVYVLDGSHRS